MSRRVRRRLNENPLDQWTPATVAAAQANRPRRYGTGLVGGMGAHSLDATGLGWIYRYQLQMYNGEEETMGDYSSGVVDRGNALGLDRFGRAVQTFRQAVARIVRRAKWRRIIRALRLRGNVVLRGVLHSRPPRMWPRVRDPAQASDQEVSNYQARFGPTLPIGPSESVYHYGGLRGTGTRGFD